MKTALERIRQESDEIIKRAQNIAVKLYNMEEFADDIQEIRDAIGSDHAFSVSDSWWNPADVYISYYLKPEEGFTHPKIVDMLDYIFSLENKGATIREDSYDEGQWKEWRISLGPGCIVSVRMHFGESNHCRYEETGEIEEVPIRKLVCE